MKTYTEAVETFLKAADWLGEKDQPMITGLEKLAGELDTRFSAATYAQYGLTFRYLERQRPQVNGPVEEEDPDLGEL